MSIQHKDLAAGRRADMSFLEQMANVGSEVERAINWRLKNNEAYSQKAWARALELLDLTIASAKGFPRLRELTRTREGLVDFFAGTNEFNSTINSWKKYFMNFAVAVRKGAKHSQI